MCFDIISKDKKGETMEEIINKLIDIDNMCKEIITKVEEKSSNID